MRKYNIGDKVRRGGLIGTVVMLDFKDGYDLIACTIGWGEDHDFYPDIPEEIRKKYKKFWMILPGDVDKILDCPAQLEEPIQSHENYPIWN